MQVKCKCHGIKIERDTAYKVVVNGVNHYYCSKAEYDKIIDSRNLKDEVFKRIFEIFGRKVTNTALYKEMAELDETYTYEKIKAYIDDNFEYLQKVMSKGFTSEYAKIRYLMAIFKNTLADYTQNTKKEIIPNIEVEIPEMKFKPNVRKKSLEYFENQVGDEK